jgi:hypothetical protein
MNQKRNSDRKYATDGTMIIRIVLICLATKTKLGKQKKETKQVKNVEREGDREIMFHYFLLTLYIHKGTHVMFKPWPFALALSGDHDIHNREQK